MKVTEYKAHKTVAVNLEGTGWDETQEIRVQKSAIYKNEGGVWVYVSQYATHLTLDEVDTLIAALMVVRQGVAEQES